MQITKEYLQGNLDSVRARLERAKNDVLMYDGAAQALENMMTYLDEPEDKKDEDEQVQETGSETG